MGVAFSYTFSVKCSVWPPLGGVGEIIGSLGKVPTTQPMLMQLLTCVPLLLLAYHVATLRGNNVDQPRSLAKKNGGCRAEKSDNFLI